MHACPMRGPRRGRRDPIAIQYLVCHGAVDQKTTLLSCLVSDDLTGAFAVPEPGAGSDVLALAKSDGNHHVAFGSDNETDQNRSTDRD
jgi:hypothetical protein